MNVVPPLPPVVADGLGHPSGSVPVDVVEVREEEDKEGSLSVFCGGVAAAAALAAAQWRSGAAA
eukprot:4781157-Pyramimonas_sp.AAC.1